MLKSLHADRPNQPTNQKSEKWNNFDKFCPIGLKLGMEVKFTPLHRIEKFSDAPINILQTSPTNPKVTYRENLKMP